MIKEATGGEGEISTFQNLRWPKIYYNYFCAPAAFGERLPDQDPFGPPAR